MNRLLKIIVGLLSAALAVGACAPSVPQDTPEPTPVQEAPAQLPNPASQNCVEQGGTLSIERRPDGGEYGVCVFEDDRQCEEWAMLRGDCPVGGVRVTGYVTPAARFCAITGGAYTVTANSNTEDEQGTCSFPNGATCDVWDYYRGECGPGGEAKGAGMPNPAAKYCVDQGHKWEIRTEAGGDVGYCLFDDGTECEEWAFYRGECGPGGEAEGAGLPNPASQHCADEGGKLEIRTEAGGEVGYCLFDDGSECEEWAFFRGDCAPGDSKP